MRILVSQRIIPHYRVPLFRELSRRLGGDFIVVYGQGLVNGSQKNSSDLSGVNSFKSKTIFLNYKGGYGTTQLRPLHTGLLKQILQFKPNVIIVEPSTNFYNNIVIFSLKLFLSFRVIWHESGRLPAESRSVHRRLVDPIISWMIKRSDGFLTYTSYADKSLLRDFGISSDRIFRAQNTIDIKALREKYVIEKEEIIQEKFRLYGQKPVFLYIGSIEKRKKVDWLMESSIIYNGVVQILIVGDGDYLEELQAKYGGLPNVSFLGKITDNRQRAIGLCDVVCLPALGGLSILDAMACGKAFLGSRMIENGGIIDYIEDGYSGLLCDENFESFANSFASLADNIKRTRFMGDRAFQISHNFDIDKMANSYITAAQFVYNEGIDFQ